MIYKVYISFVYITFDLMCDAVLYCCIPCDQMVWPVLVQNHHYTLDAKGRLTDCTIT